MHRSTARELEKGKWIALPLLVLGLLVVPFVFLPAHALPGHAAMMAASHSAAPHHDESAEHEHHGPGESAPGTAGHHDGPGSGAPDCDAGPDYSAISINRGINNPDDLDFLLFALMLTAVVAALPAGSASWAARLRQWLSRPPRRTTGIEFLHFACIART
ncbi:hypothetical protein REH65_20635 [Saccharopolyspora sp. ID03-671]|uniref:hypothetical protein n=1 Tax=Saccharopolyspora sp. ID03-671 TaxID=3073066 RepID=UPI003244DF0C